MQITKNSVVLMDYTLTAPDGQVIDSSQGKEPMAYLHGHGMIIPGLERQLEGKSEGDEIIADVAPEEAYGLRNEQAIQKVPRQAFQGVDNIQPGMQFQARGPQGQVANVMVIAVDDQFVTVDSNHPLAGVPLRFQVKIVGVREATPEELSHGHAHGPGGAHHHHEEQGGGGGQSQQPPEPRQSRQRR